MLRAASGAVTELETRDSGSGCLHNPGLRGETSRVSFTNRPPTVLLWLSSVSRGTK